MKYDTFNVYVDCSEKPYYLAALVRNQGRVLGDYKNIRDLSRGIKKFISTPVNGFIWSMIPTKEQGGLKISNNRATIVPGSSDVRTLTEEEKNKLAKELKEVLAGK